MIDQVHKDMALAMLYAQSQDYGTIPDNAEAKALYAEWESLGWVESHVDNDGDRVYLLTYAGRDALLWDTTTRN